MPFAAISLIAEFRRLISRLRRQLGRHFAAFSPPLFSSFSQPLAFQFSFDISAADADFHFIFIFADDFRFISDMPLIFSLFSHYAA
jgi:hypothetical protein